MKTTAQLRRLYDAINDPNASDAERAAALMAQGPSLDEIDARLLHVDMLIADPYGPAEDVLSAAYNAKTGQLEIETSHEIIARLGFAATDAEIKAAVEHYEDSLMVF